MREIKFRAWVQSKSTGSEWMNDCVEFIGGLVNDNFNKRDSKFADITYMQYTGLKDREGRELFEKDIVDEKGQLSVCCWIDEVAAFAFVPILLYPMKNWQTLFEEHAVDTFFRNDTPNKYVTIVGNIYENPELLDK